MWDVCEEGGTRDKGAGVVAGGGQAVMGVCVRHGRATANGRGTVTCTAWAGRSTHVGVLKGLGNDLHTRAKGRVVGHGVLNLNLNAL